MGALTGHTPGSTYGDLLQAGNAGAGVPATLQQIQDGLGNNTGLWLSQTQVGVGGNDIAFARVAAQVVKPTNGGSGNGWFQNPAGCAALAGDLPNATSTFANSNLSFTVLAGRSYKITGLLRVANTVLAEGAKVDFNGGNATATTFICNFFATQELTTVTSASLATTAAIGSLTSSPEDILVSGYLKVNAGGTLILRFAENSHSTGSASLKAGSWLCLEDVATL